MHNRVYVLDTAELGDEALFDRWLGKMTSRRRQKIAAFRFDKDKRLCLGAGILLAAAVQGGEKEPEYLVSAHGKPYFEDGRICFNLSHSGTLAVCAVSDREVGADVQQYRHFEDNLIRFVFQPGEVQRIYACETPEQRDILCTRLWTVKESIMKYLGTGIGLAPKKIRLDMNGAISAQCSDLSLEKLHFTHYQPDGCELTVCSEYEQFTDSLCTVSAKEL